MCNEILKYYSVVRPQLREEPEFTRIAFVLRYALREKLSVEDVCEAIIHLIPDQRELWLIKP